MSTDPRSLFQAGTVDNDINELWPTSNRRYKSTDRYRLVRDYAKDRILNKETNMMNRLERRRHALNLKWQNKLRWYAIGAAVVFFVLPLMVKFSSLCWEWMLS